MLSCRQVRRNQRELLEAHGAGQCGELVVEVEDPDEERPEGEVDLEIEDQEEAVEGVDEVAALGLEEVVEGVGEETQTLLGQQVLEGEDNMLF